MSREPAILCSSSTFDLQARGDGKIVAEISSSSRLFLPGRKLAWSSTVVNTHRSELREWSPSARESYEKPPVRPCWWILFIEIVADEREENQMLELVWLLKKGARPRTNNASTMEARVRILRLTSFPIGGRFLVFCAAIGTTVSLNNYGRRGIFRLDRGPLKSKTEYRYSSNWISGGNAVFQREPPRENPTAWARQFGLAKDRVGFTSWHLYWAVKTVVRHCLWSSLQLSARQPGCLRAWGLSFRNCFVKVQVL